MSSTLHFSLIRDPKLLDIIDEEWEADVLPDEDIMLPSDVKAPGVDEHELGIESEETREEGWGELGLDVLELST